MDVAAASLRVLTRACYPFRHPQGLLVRPGSHLALALHPLTRARAPSPYVLATCCSDGSSCCPSDHPVCDLDNGMCAASATATSDMVPMGHKFPATRDFSRSSLLHLVSGAAEDKA